MTPTGPYDVERALRDGSAWSAGIKPTYPTRPTLRRVLWLVLLVLLATGAAIAVYVGVIAG